MPVAYLEIEHHPDEASDLMATRPAPCAIAKRDPVHDLFGFNEKTLFCLAEHLSGGVALHPALFAWLLHDRTNASQSVKARLPSSVTC